jgi:hypothetical protein
MRSRDGALAPRMGHGGAGGGSPFGLSFACFVFEEKHG